MDKQKKYQTPNTMMCIIFLISQVFAIIFILIIFTTMKNGSANTDYIFGKVTFFDIFPFLFVVILFVNLIQYNNFPIWVIFDETGIATTALVKVKKMIPWDLFRDVGVINTKNTSYIYFSEYELSDIEREELTKIFLFNFGAAKKADLKSSKIVLIYDDETQPLISAYYHGEIKDHRKQYAS